MARDNYSLCELGSLRAGYETSWAGMMSNQVPDYQRGSPALGYVAQLNSHRPFFTPKLKNILEVNPDDLPVEYPYGFPCRKPVWVFYSLYGRIFEEKSRIQLVGGIGYWELVSTIPATPLSPEQLSMSPSRVNMPPGFVMFSYTTYKYYRGDGEETGWLMAMRKMPSPQRIDAWVECTIYDRIYAPFVSH